MDKALRYILLTGCTLYFCLCVIAGLEVSHTLHGIMIAGFLIFGVVVVVRYLVLIFAAIYEKFTTTTGTGDNWAPSVSIIVPAFNEETLIEESLISLMSLDYPDYEIIIVDDGSTDGTTNKARLVAVRSSQVPVHIISQSNAGKAWALNTGIVHAQGEIVVCVDADSKLNPDALRIGVNYFKDPRVGAVGGFVDIINLNRILMLLQRLEYLISQNFIRRALSVFNIVTVVPGPIGMFRKIAVRQIGGYNTSHDCFAEDADLTVRLLANGWRVKGDTRMTAFTEAPNTIFALLRQRYRWKRGIFQAFFDNVYRLVTSPNSAGLYIAGILVFESFLFDILNFGITLFALTSVLAFAKFNIFLWAFVALLILDLCVFVFATIEQKNLFEQFWLFFLSRISYAYILQAWGVFALFDELFSTKMSWDKLERTGNFPIKGSS